MIGCLRWCAPFQGIDRGEGGEGLHSGDVGLRSIDPAAANPSLILLRSPQLLLDGVTYEAH